MTAGELIKEKRTAKKFTMGKVAKALQVDESLISYFENNKRKLQKTYIKPLAELLEISESYLETLALADTIVRENGDNPYIVPALERAIAEISLIAEKKKEAEEKAKKEARKKSKKKKQNERSKANK